MARRTVGSGRGGPGVGMGADEAAWRFDSESIGPPECYAGAYGGGIYELDLVR